MAGRNRPISEMPLLRWGEARHAAREHRRRLRRRVAVAALGIACLAATIAWRPHPLLVWNASASAPLGLYSLGSPSGLHVGDMVIARAPPRVVDLAARRHYLPPGVPLVKRVAALAGDRVCARDGAIWIDGALVVRRRQRDAAGRPLPWWRGCFTLGDDALFLLMTDSSGSFDGRYFGMSERGDVIGKAHLLWRR